MQRALERRIVRLENVSAASHPPNPPMMIVCDPGESEDAAIFRICGEAGLPSRPPKAGPHLILVPLGSEESQVNR
jgi:hypothetical protein